MQPKKNTVRGRPKKRCKRMEDKPKHKIQQQITEEPMVYMNKRTICAGCVIALISIILMFIVSCTYSINLIDSEGKAIDVIDQTSDTDPQISIPIPGITTI